MKYLSDYEIPSSIYSIMQRNDSTQGNYPVSLYLSADMRSCWFDVNTGELPYDDRKMRVYGALPVRFPAFYKEVFDETSDLIDVILGQLLHTQMKEQTAEETQLLTILNRYRDSYPEAGIHVTVHDLDLPKTSVEANGGHSAFMFPHHPEFPYDPASVRGCVQWWAEADADLVASFLERYLETRSSNEFLYVPFEFKQHVENLIEIAKIQSASASA